MAPRSQTPTPLRLAALLGAGLVAAALLPAGRVWAEGAARVFDCTSLNAAELRLTIEPVQVDATGKGRIRVIWDGREYDGVTSSDHGPFQFGTDTDYYALLIEGTAPDGRLKAELHHATASRSTLTPYLCETDL